MDYKFLDLKSIHAPLVPELVQASRDIIESGDFISSNSLSDFENNFSKFCGTKYAVGVANGLDALVLCLRSLGIGPGDEVLVPEHTFVATWLAVSQVGATIVSVEVDPLTYNIDSTKIEKHITASSKAIIAVHLYGQPAQMLDICEVAKKYNLKVIEDAAQAHGAQLQNTQVGSFGDISAFSFYPGKNLGALGDGGAVVSSNKLLAKEVRILRNYGSEKKYHHTRLGVNSRLDEIQASYLNIKLNYINHWNKIRKNQAEIYMNNITNVKIKLPKVANNCLPVWHLFVVSTSDRNRFQKYLLKNGVETLIHYPISPSNQKAYKNTQLRGSLLKAQDICDAILSLPIGPHLKESDIHEISIIINNY